MAIIKKAILSLFIILLILLALAGIVFSADTAKAKEEAKLKKSADNSSITLEIIPKNDEFEILEDMGDWYKVNYKKIRGYVKKEQVEIIKQSSNNDKNGVNSNYTNEQSQNTNENTVNENTVTGEQTTKEENKNEQEKETLENIQVGEKLYTKAELQVYLRPLPTSMKMEKLAVGTEVTVVDETCNWIYVLVNGKTGWIRKELLAKTKENNTNNNNNNDSNNNSKKLEENNINKTGYITTDGINFRQKADTDSKVLKTFATNAKVTILKEEGNWYKIKHNDQEGYVLKTYVSEKKAAEVTSRSSVRREETSSKQEENKQEEAKTTTKEASSKGSQVVETAKKYLGSRYVYGGSSPSGFDCSGFTMYIYKQFGVNLPHSATAQSSKGTKVEKKNLQPGDIVFFTNYKTGKGIGHCGIYIGGGQFIHASTEKTGVITTSLNNGSHAKRYVTAVRIF